jgi:hypothetical protein
MAFAFGYFHTSMLKNIRAFLLSGQASLIFKNIRVFHDDIIFKFVHTIMLKSSIHDFFIFLFKLAFMIIVGFYFKRIVILKKHIFDRTKRVIH